MLVLRDIINEFERWNVPRLQIHHDGYSSLGALERYGGLTEPHRNIGPSYACPSAGREEKMLFEAASQVRDRSEKIHERWTANQSFRDIPQESV